MTRNTVTVAFEDREGSIREIVEAVRDAGFVVRRHYRVNK